jgi:hypothetical protein
MPDGIDRAFDRLDDFVAVQGSHPTMESVLALQAAVGIDDGERAVIRDRVAALGYSDRAGSILLGLLVGLFAAQDGP